MTEPDLVRTGISGLDSILSEGIPRGNVILLEGAIGTGKTTCGVEFVYRGASEFGEPGIIVLFEVSPEKLVRDAAKFGWDLPALERERKLKIVFTTRQVFRQELQQADSLLIEEAMEMRARRIFIDGVAGIIGNANGAEPREVFHVLVEALQRENLTAILAVEASALNGGHAVALPEESIADTVIRLRGGHLPRHGALNGDREIAGTCLSDGTPYVPDRRWPRPTGVPPGSSAAATVSRPRRRVRYQRSCVHGCSRSGRVDERRLLPWQHDGGCRDLRRW